MSDIYNAPESNVDGRRTPQFASGVLRVETDLTRKDLVRFNLSKLFRHRSNLNLFLMIFVVIFFMTALEALGSEGDTNWLKLIALVGLASAGGFAVAYLIGLLFVVFSASAATGTLGRHVLIIEDDGFREQTEANDSLHYWRAIRKIDKSSYAITVQVNSYLFHVIPQREFESASDFETFYAELMRRFEAAQ
ncbi:MAG: YcxB family protein [Pseudomonadota bacterium]